MRTDIGSKMGRHESDILLKRDAVPLPVFARTKVPGHVVHIAQVPLPNFVHIAYCTGAHSMVYYNQKRKEKRINKMKQELIDRLNTLNKKRFYLAMKDFWNRSDFEADEAMKKEIAEIEKKLENF